MTKLKVSSLAIRKAICVSLLSFSLVAAPIAQADTITFTPDNAASKDKGTFSGEIPIATIGSLSLPDGMAVFSGHTVQIQAVPEWLFDRTDVLTGAVINASLTSSGPNSIVKGLAYFTGGTWISNLGPLRARDTIRTVAGGIVSGTIQAALPDGLEILEVNGNRRKVVFTDIENINSPRAFGFAATAESLKLDPNSTLIQSVANQIVFAPSALAGRIAMHRPSVPKSNLPGTEGGVSNSVIVSEILIDVAVNIIVPAVAIPLCFAVNRNNETKEKIREAQASAGTFGPISP